MTGGVLKTLKKITLSLCLFSLLIGDFGVTEKTKAQEPTLPDPSGEYRALYNDSTKKYISITFPELTQKTGETDGWVFYKDHGNDPPSLLRPVTLKWPTKEVSVDNVFQYKACQLAASDSSCASAVSDHHINRIQSRSANWWIFVKDDRIIGFTDYDNQQTGANGRIGSATLMPTVPLDQWEISKIKEETTKTRLDKIYEIVSNTFNHMANFTYGGGSLGLNKETLADLNYANALQNAGSYVFKRQMTLNEANKRGLSEPIPANDVYQVSLELTDSSEIKIVNDTSDTVTPARFSPYQARPAPGNQPYITISHKDTELGTRNWKLHSTARYNSNDWLGIDEIVYYFKMESKASDSTDIKALSSYLFIAAMVDSEGAPALGGEAVHFWFTSGNYGYDSHYKIIKGPWYMELDYGNKRLVTTFIDNLLQYTFNQYTNTGCKAALTVAPNVETKKNPAPTDMVYGPNRALHLNNSNNRICQIDSDPGNTIDDIISANGNSTQTLKFPNLNDIGTSDTLEDRYLDPKLYMGYLGKWGIIGQYTNAHLFYADTTPAADQNNAANTPDMCASFRITKDPLNWALCGIIKLFYNLAVWLQDIGYRWLNAVLALDKSCN